MSQASELIARQYANGAANARVWADILYNVKAYGAKGDWNGTTGTDDTASVQATIDAAIAAGGKAVFFPHGTYKVTALTNLSSVVLFGDNASFSGISDTISQIGKPISNLVYNVKDYGAKGDGVINSGLGTDDTIAINNTIAACKAAGGGIIFFPDGTYMHSSPFTIDFPCTIRGAGRWNTLLVRTTNTIDGFIINSDYVTIEDLSINQAYTLTASVVSAGIRIQTADKCCFERLVIGGYYYGLWSEVAGGHFTLRKTYVVNSYKYGVYITNTAAPDGGDSSILDCVMDSSYATADAAIRHEGGGGFRVANNKLFRHRVGYDLQVRDGVSSSILLIVNNSIEGQTLHHIRLGRLGTTGSFSQVSIMNNQTNIIYSPEAGYAAMMVNSSTLRDVVVSGNTFSGTNTYNGIVLESVNGIEIDGNSFALLNKAITINNSGFPANVVIGTNVYRNITVPVEDNTTAYNPPLVNYFFSRAVQVASTAAYTNLFQIDLNLFRGNKIELMIEGSVQGGGSGVFRYIEIILARYAGNITMTNLVDNTQGTVFDIQYDVTTTPGSLIIGVKRNTGAAGTSLEVNTTLKVLGNATRVKVL